MVGRLKWNPIATPPKPGKLCIVIFAGGRVPARCDINGQWLTTDGRKIEPTSWTYEDLR